MGSCSYTEFHVSFVWGTEAWWWEFWDKLNESVVSPLPFGEEGKELSDVGDDTEYELSDPPHEKVSEPISVISLNQWCHCYVVLFYLK